MLSDPHNAIILILLDVLALGGDLPSTAKVSVGIMIMHSPFLGPSHICATHRFALSNPVCDFAKALTGLNVHGAQCLG